MNSHARQPIESVAAWVTEDLRDSSSWRFTLTDDERVELLQAHADLQTQPDDVETLNVHAVALPRVAEKMQQVQEEVDTGRGLAILRGFPLQDLDATAATKLLWVLAHHLGTPLPQTADGARVFPVRDERLAADDPRARGPSSNKQLSFHTDRCDVIAFLCLQQAKSGGDNDIVSSVTLHNELLKRHPELVETLYEPYLYERHNVDTGNARPVYEQPIFSLCDGHFAAFLMRVLIERAYRREDTPEMTERQRAALDQIAELAEDPRLHFRFRQEPGDIVFFNNLVTLHRRTAFEDHPELERRRHLVRLWLSIPNSRPLDPSFAPTFGDCRAGAVRGGMRVRL